MQILQWFLPWEPSYAVLLATAVTLRLYIAGSRTYPMPVLQKISFWIGVLALYGVCHTQFEYYAEHLFFMHQLQSLALHQLGPFLIVISEPWQALSLACPATLKRWLLHFGATPAQRWIEALCHPLVVTLLFLVLSGVWLLPAVHFIAMLDWRIHALMNASMAFSGLLFWAAILDRHRTSTAGRIAMLFAVVPPQILVGALIFFSSHELYPIYSLCGRAFAGMNSVTDQQLGGLVLWMHAAMMSVIGVLIVIRREWRRVQIA